MVFETKWFDELSVAQLYEILKSRAEIFMLEQNIICQDMDDVDYVSLHCFMTDESRVCACLRAFYKEEGIVKIGRVLTLDHKKGMGRVLLEKSLEAIKEKFTFHKIVVDSQKQAEGFYAKFGFKSVSDVFLDEGVEHISMELDI